MLNSNKHIINKVFLEVNTNSKEKGYYLKDHIDAFLQKDIFSYLETYFDELDSKNPSRSIQLEKLNIAISINQNLDFEDFKEQLLKHITKQVEEAFEKKATNTEGFKVIQPKEKEIESFFHFLETGTNPWWNTLNNAFKIVDDTTFDEILNDESFSFKWKNAVQKPIVRTRFIKQFSDSQIIAIIKNGILLKKNSYIIITIEAIKKQIEKSSTKNQLLPNQRFLTWEIVVLSLLEISDAVIKQKLSRLIYDVLEFHKKKSFSEQKELFLKEIENQIKNQNELAVLADLDTAVSIIEKKLDAIILKEKETKIKNETAIEFTESQENNEKVTASNNDKNLESLSNNEKAIDKRDQSLEKEENTIETDSSGLYVENAGLVVIHPFLKSLFENCKLLNKDNTINNPEVATHLLHYIATGKEQDYENAMVFEKFLCNIPIAQPIERNIVLSDEMKKEVSVMLQAVLSNWDIMKTASAELLQNEFLQRPGKLSSNGNENPVLIIERKTQDILLDKLNWNLSIIKLAWKKQIIYVNW